MFRNAGMLAVVSLFLTLFPHTAHAQIPTKGDIFLGYSYLSAPQYYGGRDSMNGWQGSLEGKVFPFVGIVADISGEYGLQNFPETCGTIACSILVSAGLHNVLFGPRVSVPIGKFTPFAEGFVGVSHIAGSAGAFSDSHTALSEAVGGGFDYRLIHGFGLRAEADLLQTRFFNTTQNNIRLSTGLAFHF